MSDSDSSASKETPAPNTSSLLDTYLSRKIVEAHLCLDQSRNRLSQLQQLVWHRKECVKALEEAVENLDDAPGYVARVCRILSRRLVKIKLGGELLALPIRPDLPLASQLRPGCKVAVRSNITGELQICRLLPAVQDPMVALMLVQKDDAESTYELIGGLEKQIMEVKEVVELPILHPELFESLGISPPKAALLYGPPGTGKTMLARAVARSAKCTFFRLSGTELVQKYIGEGARLLRELFALARQRAPSIIFLDEIDSIGRKRAGGDSGGSATCGRTMVELLNQLDGFDAAESIKVILATNRIDSLDPVLLRPGRVDRKIFFPPPSQQGRLDILRIHSKRMNLGRTVCLDSVAGVMQGASGAELKLLCQEAAMSALRDGRRFVTQEDFLQKTDTVMKRIASQAIDMHHVK